MNEQEMKRYNQSDMPFYKNEISPILPENVLDFHTHVWPKEVWKLTPWEDGLPGGKYMVTTQDYGIDDLLNDGRRMFPDKKYKAVCFGQPMPSADSKTTNDYTAKAAAYEELYPLIIAGKDTMDPAELEDAIIKRGFYGYKVFLNWFGNNYQSVYIEDMIGPAEMKLADKLGLVVLLHVPRSERLADKDVQSGVERLSKDYPNASIVLAHCGRCYLPDEARKAIGSISKFKNVFLDTAMVMDPTVMEIVLDNIGPERLLFATDLPIANMRGRRVYVMDHWVDLVLEGYPESEYRIGSNNMHATFMVYEIILAIGRAAQMAGLTKKELEGIYYGNGMALLERVKR